jgi:hypothetical protein
MWLKPGACPRPASGSRLDWPSALVRSPDLACWPTPIRSYSGSLPSSREPRLPLRRRHAHAADLPGPELIVKALSVESVLTYGVQTAAAAGSHINNYASTRTISSGRSRLLICSPTGPPCDQRRKPGAGVRLHQRRVLARYDRELFGATLDDWGWYGDPAEAPDWWHSSMFDLPARSACFQRGK